MDLWNNEVGMNYAIWNQITHYSDEKIKNDILLKVYIGALKYLKPLGVDQFGRYSVILPDTQLIPTNE